MSSEWKARRFWKDISVRPAEGDKGWHVYLDARELRTPGKHALTLPTRALAEAVAEEWRAQDGVIAPLTMPLTRAVNSAVEKVALQREGVAAMLADYGGTDLLCYRADDPPDLVAAQAAAWDPLIDWAASQGAPLRVTTGVIPIAQDAAALAALHAQVAALDTFGLTALHDLVTLPGSLVLGLAVIEGHITADQAHDLSRLDEEHQAQLWGGDAEADEAAGARRAAMQVAERLWRLSRPD